MLFGTVLTIWALTGDDIRVAFSSMPADDTFNVLVIFCFCFFTFEIVVSCLGIHDYFMGFFFCLDVLSTATLILDHTVVAYALFANSDEDDLDKTRTSKTARLGAKMARIVRVLRLLRIVKLYKVAATAARHREREKNKRRHRTLFDDHDFLLSDEGDEVPDNRHLEESQVGKKLSERITRRVIILVLSMLIVLPVLKADASSLNPLSAEYGADEVQETFKSMLAGNVTRDAYQEVLLRYIYYHNWFSGHGECPNEDALCPNDFLSHNFWVGIRGEADESILREYARRAQLTDDRLQAWEADLGQQKDILNYGNMPSEAHSLLTSAWASHCTSSFTSLGFSLLVKKIENFVDYTVRCPSDLRKTEFAVYTPSLPTEEEYKQWHFVFFFDLRPFTQQEGVLGLLNTLFVCIVLCVAASFIAKDARRLVLEPVEKMIKTVEAIRDNPLIALQMSDDAFKQEEVSKLKTKLVAQDFSKLKKCCQGEKGEMLETQILEKTIIKLGSLIALCFGEAGANIVSHTMQHHTANVDCMLAGSTVDCIMGNARIRDFSLATEVLHGKVMTFVNQVAEIVHGVVDECHGAANKNNGNNFFVVWRTVGMSREELTKVADVAILAFSVILGAVHTSPVLASYRSHPGLQQHLKSGCRVNMSFGLHHGYAIEGAVGSEFKIDASYLSPNVSVAASVEQATTFYRVPIIASQTVVDLCSPQMLTKMRLIDKVILKGCKTPLELYSMDMDYLSLDVHHYREVLKWNPSQRVKARKDMGRVKGFLWEEAESMADVFDAIPEIAKMRSRHTIEFHQVFNMGYQNYSQGEWKVAKSLLGKANTLLGVDDGPSGFLLRFMEEPYAYEAPSDWRGFHELADV